MAQYLDYEGLNLYDALIKELIKSGKEELIQKIEELVGGSDVDVSIAEIVSILDTLATKDSLNNKVGDLTNADAELSTKIDNLRREHKEDIQFVKDYIAELLGDSDATGEDIISMSEISAALKRLAEALGIEEDSDGEPSVIERVDALEDGSVYVPGQLIQDADMTSSAHAGLPATKASVFADKRYTYSEMFDMILFPTQLPVMTQPSVSWMGVSNKNVLVGENITNYVITTDNLDSHLSYNLGSWTFNSGMTASNGHQNPTLTKSTNRPAAVEGEYFMPAKTITFQASVVFDAGDEPRDNKGVEQTGMAYAGGTKTTSNYTLTPYYNWYASTTTGGVLDVQPVIASCGVSTIKTGDTSKVASSSNGTLLAAHKYGVEAQMFSTPRAITEFWQFNTAANVWAQLELTDGVPAGWMKTRDTNMDMGIEYYTYTYNGPDNDPIYIILKF